MLIFRNNEVVGNIAPNIYGAMKPWQDANGVARWIVDAQGGAPFTDSDGQIYLLRLRTPAEAQAIQNTQQAAQYQRPVINSNLLDAGYLTTRLPEGDLK